MGAGLWAVVGDTESHGGGALKLAGDSTTGTVFINNKEVIVGSTDASADTLVIGSHANPKSDSVSGSVFAYNKGAHRNSDTRVCGATTTVVGQSDVFVDI